MKCGPGHREGCRIDDASVSGDDLSAKGEADAGAFVLVAGIESLEDGKDLFCERGGEADAVVGDIDGPVYSSRVQFGELPGLPGGDAFGRDVDDRRLVFP